jgi:hypothetical protein
MSANPQTHEEAIVALRRIINHPKTFASLMSRPPMLARFVQQPVSEEDQVDFDDEAMNTTRLVGVLTVGFFHVAPMQDTQRYLTMFAQSQMEQDKVRFGFWHLRHETMQEVPVQEITNDLAKLQFIVKVLQLGTLDALMTSDIPLMYI